MTAKGHDKTYQRVGKTLDALIISSVFFALLFGGLALAEARPGESMNAHTQQVIERIRGGDYQIGRSLEEGCDHAEAYAKHQVGWVTCRNSEAYAREFTCYQRPIEWNNGDCGVWWRSLPRRAGVPMGAN